MWVMLLFLSYCLNFSRVCLLFFLCISGERIRWMVLKFIVGKGRLCMLKVLDVWFICCIYVVEMVVRLYLICLY